jgi:hypothetical protein
VRIYRWLCITSAVVVSIVGVGGISLGIQDRRWPLAIISAAVVFLSWYAFYRVEKGAVTLSVMCTGFVCLFILARLYERGRFVIDHGGWERADGYGSPLAFLLGLITELFWLAFFLITTMWGLRIRLSAEDERAQAGTASTCEPNGRP